MRSRFLLGATAAAADADRTRFAFLTAAHIPAQHVLAPALRAIGHRVAPHVAGAFAERVRRRATGG